MSKRAKYESAPHRRSVLMLVGSRGSYEHPSICRNAIGG